MPHTMAEMFSQMFKHYSAYRKALLLLIFRYTSSGVKTTAERQGVQTLTSALKLVWSMRQRNSKGPGHPQEGAGLLFVALL